jgi:hypothetical protein
MVIVIVRWYLKKGSEENFKNIWIDKMEPLIKTGLFREFFSTPIDIVNEKYHTLDVESMHYTTFINVGIWRDIRAFDDAIGSFIPNRDKPDLEKYPSKQDKELIEVFDFEFKLRERIVMTVEEDRTGNWQLPNPTLRNKF